VPWPPLELILLVAALALAVPACYLALLSLLALPRPRDTEQPARSQPRFAVLVPAHNEASTIGRLLRSLAETAYPRERWHAFVVADACDDATADVARQLDATVLERPDGGQGKGQALAWLIERVLGAGTRFDAALLVDADCWVSPNTFAVLAARLDAGRQAIQLDYRLVSGGRTPSLRELAFALHNTVRSLGRSRLRASTPLLGSGMCFRREVLERHRWRACGLAEDREQGYALLRAGVAVTFAPEAPVLSDLPATRYAARSQHERWERGRLRLATRAPALLVDAIRRRDLRLLDAALDALTPPLAVLSMTAVAIAVAVFVLQSWPAAVAGMIGVGALLVHVLAGLIALRAPASAYRALALAPAYALWKLGVYGRALLTPGARRWVRTARTQGQPGK
jgi:cellulose synthase/poly-beta-1,6-N-acetylglucosamine synthase-like glycosyltransferase